MLRNYLKIAYRTLKRNKGYTFINVTGLAVGLAACLLIGLWVQDELSYDDFHEKAERIYRVIVETDDRTTASVGGAMTPALAEYFPAIETITGLTRQEVLISRAGSTELFEEPNFFYADSTFFDVFDGFALAQGNPEAVLSRPSTVVLTPEVAEKYFGDENPIGQTLILHANTYGTRTERPLTVTGVLEEVPENTHLAFDFLTPMATYKQNVGYPTDAPFRSFAWPEVWTYVLLEEQASAEAINERLPAFIKRYREPAVAENNVPRLQPLTSIHLYSNLSNEIQAGGSITYVYIFSAIALFILLIACINFINLVTARSMERAKEVGVRKTAGARREQLIGQFLSESALLTFLALVVGVVLAEFLLPVMGALSGRSLSIGYMSNGAFWIGLAGIALFVGLVAGSYPAFVLSRFRPAQVLKSSFRAGTAGGTWLRKGLVVFQFAISIALIAGSLVAYQQFDFMQSARLGFDEERVLTMPVEENYETLKAELRGRPGVLAVTGADIRPGFGSGGNAPYETAPFTNEAGALAEQRHMGYLRVDYGFLEMMDLKIVAGRGFSKEFSDEGRRLEANDQYFDFAAPIRGRAVVINESAAEQLGWTPEEAVGKKLRFFELDNNRFYFDVGGPIVGVVEDYHAAPLYEEISHIAYTLMGGNNYILVKMASGNAEDAVGALRAAWEEVNPLLPFEASFLDQDLENLYRAEQQLGHIVGLFALLAVGVACLGLFGLAAYTAERRTKEIGIRKVLGASVPSIVALLSKDFLKLVLTAFVIAAPVAYWAMSRWLEDFAYRIELGPWIFVGAGALALVIALATVSYQAIRAALANPVEALRSE